VPLGVPYFVVKGDSLWKIAKREYGDGRLWRKLYEDNRDVIGDDPNKIYVGQEFILRFD